MSERFSHAEIVASQGSGKTNLLSALIQTDMNKVAAGSRSSSTALTRFSPAPFYSDGRRRLGGDVLYVARDPLDVLKAYEGGICAVSFVGDITADSLSVLSHFMDELQVPSIEFI